MTREEMIALLELQGWEPCVYVDARVVCENKSWWGIVDGKGVWFYLPAYFGENPIHYEHWHPNWESGKYLRDWSNIDDDKLKLFVGNILCA